MSGYCWVTSSNSTTASGAFTGYYSTITITAAVSRTYGNDSYQPYKPTPETKKQKSDRLRCEQESRDRAEQLRKEKEAAIKCAEELLKDHIGVEAFSELHKVGYIELDSQKYQGRKYRVPQEHMNMIDVLDKDGNVIDRLCVHPSVACPPGDHILSRLVLLELAEEYLLKQANHNLV